MNDKKQTAPKIGIVSLGCPKALVDSERIITQLRSEGYELSADYEGADAVIVNTCGFLDSAKKESLAAIGDAMDANGKVIVTGCMGAEPEQIMALHPKVSAITGPQQYEDVMNAVHAIVKPLHEPYEDLIPPQGIKLTPPHYAYLKISEGCNNKCNFCIIPKLRGPMESRPIIQVLSEAERLITSGVKELLIISQDTSAYGVDMKYKEYPWKDRTARTKFIDLCNELGDMDAWIRLHYMYPYPHVDEVFGLMAEGKILPYIDIPFQHAAPNVLNSMKRPAHQEKTIDRIKNWRTICPDLTIRSTFIVGYPGETDEDFEIMLQWLKEAQLDRVGAFQYENVTGAPSEFFEPQISPEVKEERFHRFMAVQQEISTARLAAKVGKTLPILIDGMDDEGYIGRSQGDAPEIDGLVYVEGENLKAGDIVNVEIVDSDEYDLFGHLAE